MLRSRKWRAAVLAWAVLLVVAAGLLYRNSQAAYRFAREEYWRATLTFPPGDVRGDLAGGRFGPGASVEELIAAHPPAWVHRNSRFTRLRYGFLRLGAGEREIPEASSASSHRLGESTWVWAKDGRIFAAGTGWQLGEGGSVQLFGTVSDADLKLCQALSTAERNAQFTASMAAAGSAGACYFELPAFYVKRK